MSTNSLNTLSDAQLVEEVQRLAGSERRATAALIRALIEFETRKLYLGEGCSSLFTYCTQELHLSEACAFNRIEAARAARRFPGILDALADGALTLTSVRILAPHLTEDNGGRVLAAAAHRSRREVEELVAALNPQASAPPVIRRVASPEPPGSSPASGRKQKDASRTVVSGTTLDVVQDVAAPGAVDSEAGPAPVATGTGATSKPVLPAVQNVARHAPLASAVVKPVAPELYRLHVTLPATAYEKLGRAQRLLRHAVPSGDPAEILGRALTLLVDHLERRRFAEVATPRAAQTRGEGHSRQIPAAVRRSVWHRDGGRCAYIGRSGRCRETAFLEFHHVEPHAAGGRATEDNIQLRCRAHNQYEAQLYFGDQQVREGSPVWGPLIM